MNVNTRLLTAGFAFFMFSFTTACGDVGDDATVDFDDPSNESESSGDTIDSENSDDSEAGADAFEVSEKRRPPVRRGPPPVQLGTAGGFVILSKAGVSTVPPSAITGNLGVSPIASTAVTGFALTLDRSGRFSRSTQVVGKVYAASYASPTPADLTTAILNMEAAYTDAAGRAMPNFTELATGDLSGLTLVPGLYKWGTGVLMSSDVTLNGGPNDVWIFQIAGGITQAAGVRVRLAGGALSKNIFWQTFGAVSLGTTAHMAGVVLSKTAITLATGATVNGRLLSQTAVTLDASTVTQPAL